MRITITRDAQDSGGDSYVWQVLGSELQCKAGQWVAVYPTGELIGHRIGPNLPKALGIDYGEAREFELVEKDEHDAQA